jgi:hypothetical protein
MDSERPLAANVQHAQAVEKAERDRVRRREGRLRQKAKRQGLRLEKSRLRDPRLPGYGGYRLVEVSRNTVVYGAGPYAYSATLDAIEAFLAKTVG